MSDPRDVVESALATTTADGCIVVVAEQTTANLRWAANELTTNGRSTSRAVTVVSVFDRRGAASAGVVTRSVENLDEVVELVRAADAAGRQAEPAEDAFGLVEPYEHGDSWAAEVLTTGPGVFDGLATELGDVLRGWRSSGLGLWGYAEHNTTTYFLGTSTGLRRRFDQPDGQLLINAKATEGARGSTASTWAGVYTRDFTDVDVVGMAEVARQRLGWARETIELPAGRYETLLPPTTVADLMICAYWAMSGRDADEGRSVFAARSGPGTRIGEQLADLPITLRSDPAAPGLQCAPFTIATASGGDTSVFDTGAPVTATSWLDDGRLAELPRTRAWAAHVGAAPRPYVGNLIMESPGANATLEDMIASTERGLLLTSLWYIRDVDPQTLLLTGLTRDGVYLVEDGRVRAAVNNFRFNESPVDLLGRVAEVGRTEPTLSREWNDYFMRTGMPTLRVRDFNMSTVSPAS